MTEGWSDLIPELLSIIHSRLLLTRDRYAFKAVCKSWDSVVPIKSTTTPLSLPPSDDSPYYSSPCLMISQGRNNSWKLFHSVYNDFYYLDFPELMNAKIRFSKDGWLLMSTCKKLFFFNPFTKEKVELDNPPFNSCDYFDSMSFDFPPTPTSKSCIVIGIHSTSYMTVFGILNYVYEFPWYIFSPTYISRELYISTCPPIFYGDMFYFLDKYGNIRTFNRRHKFDEKWYTEYENCHPPKFEKELGQCYMAEVEGEIWGVFVMKDKSICVKKLNLGKKFCYEKLDYVYKMKWETVESLGKKCLYVGPNGSFGETCMVEGMANTIYFNKFHGCNGVLYSMSSGMYHSIDGEYISRDSHELSETYNSTWIKPPRSTWIKPVTEEEIDSWLSFV